MLFGSQAFVESSISNGGKVMILGGTRAVVMGEGGKPHVEGRLLSVAAACLMPQHSLAHGLDLIRRCISEQWAEACTPKPVLISGASPFLLQSLISWEAQLSENNISGPTELESLKEIVSFENT